ncbi:hypothetical protein PSTG_03921 [Puccinia striiformis f. sp. tritici PST-78]|uniref:Uncharacterized protein n=1 Tax=Puccinia striiformis f. sp. tritici PST-78 TaxID=1165861 RepID=A0A0L0VUW0_9BASI|nr:hypothetical protein PSTG_03921 [Puccinia striiformis f. sp. tritici PST-78]
MKFAYNFSIKHANRAFPRQTSNCYKLPLSKRPLWRYGVMTGADQSTQLNARGVFQIGPTRSTLFAIIAWRSHGGQPISRDTVPLQTREPTQCVTKQGDLNFWKVFAAQAEAGKFDDHEPFIGLVMAVAIRNKREKSGKALTGVPFAPGQRQIRTKNSLQLAGGLALINFKRVCSILEALNYTGPLAVGSNQTVCLKSLQADNGFLVGAQGGDIKFDSEEDLKKITERIIMNKLFCSKLRAYTIQVPLPVLQLCNQAGMKIISISSNGAANELPAQMEVVNLSDSHLVFYPKHARKTSVNQLLSGACLLCFGKFWFSILHLSVIVKCKNSPLYVKDAFNSGKQDNGWAYRVLHEDTLKIVLETEDCTGLAIYLFVLEELCYQYSFLDLVVYNPKLTSALIVFPSNKQVNELLKLAEKRAKTLIEFAGMQEVPGEESGNLSLDTSGQHGDVLC